MPAHRKHFIDGIPAAEVADQHGVDSQTFYRRLNRGWTVERAATQSQKAPGSPLLLDDGSPAMETAVRLGIAPWVVHGRLYDGWTLSDAVGTPVASPVAHEPIRPPTDEVWQSAVLASLDLQDDDGWFHISTATGPRVLRKVARFVATADPIDWSDRIERCTVGPRRKVMWRWVDPDGERTFRQYVPQTRARGVVGIANNLERARQESVPLQDADGWFPANTGSGPRALRLMARLYNASPALYVDILEVRTPPKGKRLWRWLTPIDEPMPNLRRKEFVVAGASS